MYTAGSRWKMPPGATNSTDGELIVPSNICEGSSVSTTCGVGVVGNTALSKSAVSGSYPEPRAEWGCEGYRPDKNWNFKEMEEFFMPEKGASVWSAVFNYCPMAWLSDEVNIRRYRRIVDSTTTS